GWLRKISSGLTFIFLLCIAWALPSILPVFNLPTPSGNYSIGSQYIHLKTNLDEIMTLETGDKRELMIKAWYPANLEHEKPEPY
ncbi:hypothetical protein, partial [Saccharophagus degradans]